MWFPSTGLDNATIANPVFTPTIAGTYTFSVIVTNEFGCSASTSVTINVLDVRCGNKNDKILMCHKTGSSSNQWTQICVSTHAVGTHLDHGDKLGSCISEVLSTTKSSNIIQKAVLKSRSITTQKVTLTAFPNPVVDIINIRLSGYSLDNEVFNVSLARMDGAVVYTTQLNSGTGTGLYRLNTGSKLLQGLYLLRVSGKELNVVTKLMVL